MPSRLPYGLALLTLFATASGSLTAQVDLARLPDDPAFSIRRDTAPPKPAPPPWVAFHADVGFLNTSGNTNVSTLSASDALTVYTSRSNKINQDFGTTYGTLDSRVQTSLWTADLRDSYTLTQAVGFYGLLGYSRNTFAGIEYRFEQGLGASFVPVNVGRNRLEFDLGVSYIEQRSTEAVSLGYGAGRGAIIYRYTFAKEAYFEQSVDDLTDFNRGSNSLVNSTTTLVAPLSKRIAIKVGYQIRYAGDPPPGFKTTDRFLTTDLQVNL